MSNQNYYGGATQGSPQYPQLPQQSYSPHQQPPPVSALVPRDLLFSRHKCNTHPNNNTSRHLPSTAAVVAQERAAWPASSQHFAAVACARRDARPALTALSAARDAAR
ncbi:hypothetical protein VE00_05154 [Pseudogymnoascus sp. WSF 3629]|nr:hypothetical protein VE00_05154 [Pseudogymnoascus sp. WSF 3629]